MSTLDNPRRHFVVSMVATGALGLAPRAWAQALVDPKDPQAAALGYVNDASKVDTKKFPKYAAGQMCSNCALYQGAAADASGNCSLFAGKKVAAKGWCSAWAKKA